MAKVSVPEKTLEHWASIYLIYRFRSKVSLWWPASGQDIAVRHFPKLPGKAVHLELKTATPGGGGCHDVYVDIGQLWEYQHSFCPPFYVLPWLRWTGELVTASSAAGLPAGELAFSRSGEDSWWFASWLKVLTTAQVASIMQPELVAHGCRQRGNKKRLVRMHPTSGAPPQWGSSNSTSSVPMVEWRSLWNELALCGRKEWPQLLRLPLELLNGGASYDLEALREHFFDFGSSGFLERSWDNLVTLAPNMDGTFSVLTDATGKTDDRGDGDEYIDDEGGGDASIEDRRIVAFLDARAIVREK